MRNTETKEKEEDRLAQAAREIYRLYGNNLQRYFDDLLGKANDDRKAIQESCRSVDPDSFKRMMDIPKNGTNRRVP